MSRKYSLSTKLVSIGTVLLVVALMSISLTLWVTWQLEGGAAAVNEAGRMRMQSWRLASTVQAPHSPADVQDLVERFDQSLVLLRNGDASRPLFVPWDDTVTGHFNDVSKLWAAQRALWLADQPPSPEQSLQSTSEFANAVDGLVLAIEHQLARLTAILNLFQFVMMALAIAGAVIMLYTGYLYVINPLAHLQAGLRRIESGEFSTRVEVDSDDEFGRVGSGFNLMAGKLQTLYDGLEAQVVTKTHHIEAQRARLEALYEVSAFVASAGNIEDLSHGFAQRVRAIMGADAVAVRWSDEANQRYLMLASDCLPSDLLEEERSLISGACSCGALKADARTRVIPIISHEALQMRNCVRAGYESLVSVPVRLQQRLVGEIDLFFRKPMQLSADETDLLDTLASHLASALESLRAAALKREAAVSEERALLARELHDSIAQSLAFLKIQVQLLRGAVHKSQPEQVETALAELDTGLRESINDVRELLVHFRTRTNTDDIEAALQETLQKFRHQTGLPATLKVAGEGLPLPADVQVQVLHVIQEALSNVRKHAGAAQVLIDIIKGEKWRFDVRDDGCGYASAAEPDTSHVGLNIMQERAARIGASVHIDSVPGQGTTVHLTLPPHPVAARPPAAATDTAAASRAQA
jgi:two-component system nitrate/nitrite sensor histidine kinase NarX